MDDLPAGLQPQVLRVPSGRAEALARRSADLIPINTKSLLLREVLARPRHSSTWSSGPSWPEIYCGVVKIDGYPMGVIGNRQGLIPKLPRVHHRVPRRGRQALSPGPHQDERVRDDVRPRPPAHPSGCRHSASTWATSPRRRSCWGLGQSLIYSIEQTDVPMMRIVLRKGHGGGPITSWAAPRPTTTPSPWHPRHRDQRHARRDGGGRASYARRLVKDKDSGKPLDATIKKMNEIVKHYEESLAALLLPRRRDLVDEWFARGHAEVSRGLRELRLADSTSICPQHHMMLPRMIQSRSSRARAPAGGAGKEGCTRNDAMKIPAACRRGRFILPT